MDKPFPQSLSQRPADNEETLITQSVDFVLKLRSHVCDFIARAFHTDCACALEQTRRTADNDIPMGAASESSQVEATPKIEKSVSVFVQGCPLSFLRHHLPVFTVKSRV